jgi:hypothetical protein
MVGVTGGAGGCRLCDKAAALTDTHCINKQTVHILTPCINTQTVHALTPVSIHKPCMSWLSVSMHKLCMSHPVSIHKLYMSCRQKARHSLVTGYRRLRQHFKVWQSSNIWDWRCQHKRYTHRDTASSLNSVDASEGVRSAGVACSTTLLMSQSYGRYVFRRTAVVPHRCRHSLRSDGVLSGSTGTAFGVSFWSLNEVPSYAVDQRTVVTYCMQQGPSWEADRFSACQQIARISCNPKVYHRGYNSPSPDHILSQRTVSASNKTGKNYNLKNWILYSLQGTSLGRSIN